MRKLIILTLLISGCGQTNRTVQQQIFDDYLLIHFNSWSDAIGRNYVPEFYYELGDTVRLRSELGMLAYPTDTTTVIELDDDNYYIILDSGTLVNITSEPKKFAFDAQVLLNDSTYNGAIFIDRFLNAQWGEDFLNEQRKSLLEQLLRLKETGLSELSTKYEVSEDSILTLISNEYYERTGRRGINY